MQRALQHYDKIVLGLCLMLFLVSGALSFRGFGRLDQIAARQPRPAGEPLPFEPRPAQVPSIATSVWPDPPAQSRGKEWIYDVFSPPVIYYNRETGEFTVTPPSHARSVATAASAAFELELVEVRQEPYRIQLIGYAGADGAYLATFDLLEVGGSAVARPGATVPRGEFTLLSFEVVKVTTTSADSMPVVENVAVAVIRDQRTGREERLTNQERKMMPRLQGVFRLRSSPGEQRLLREGMSIDLAGQRYLVTQLSLFPPQAVVSRRPPDSLGASETRTLLPVGARPPSSGTDRRQSGAIFSFPSH
jgi:hypothetical protein